MPQEVERLDRIEGIVVKLEKEMSLMAASVDSLAHSMEKLVDLTTEHRLLKQEVDHKHDMFESSLQGVKANVQWQMETFKEEHKRDIDAISSRVKEIEERTNQHLEESDKQLKEIDFLVTLVRYPKVALALLALLYLMSIKEFRDTFLGVLL